MSDEEILIMNRQASLRQALKIVADMPMHKPSALQLLDDVRSLMNWRDQALSEAPASQIEAE